MEISLERYNKMAERLTELEYLLAERKWIPVTERLPDSPIRVLIQIDNGWIITAYYDYGYDDENKFWWSVPDWDVDGDGTYALPISNQVLAWQPLPEPYVRTYGERRTDDSISN